MENLLNGKNIDEIPEFHPGSTPKKTVSNSDEFHFGPNAAPFTPAKLLDQSEAALSTRAVYGDESNATLGTSFNDSVQDPSLLNKESDPMSMSFYADKGEKNPFDLNAVQVIPDNIEEFLKQPEESSFNDTISDLPEHYPLAELSKNNGGVPTTDLDKDLSSPLEPERELLGEDDPDHIKTPEPTNENLFADDLCAVHECKDVPETESIPKDVEIISLEPILSSTKEATEVADLLGSASERHPEHHSIPEKIADNLQQVRDEVTDVLLAVSEVSNTLKELDFLINERKEESTHDAQEKWQESPILQSQDEQVSFQADIKDKVPEHLDFTSTEEIHKAEQHFGELCNPPETVETPHEDITSSVKDDEISSPLEDHVIEDSFEMVHSSPLAQEAIDQSLESEKQDLLNVEIESVTTTEVNSFLDRSLPPDVTSPLNSTHQEMEIIEGMLPSDHPLARCVYPLPVQTQGEEIDIKTESIKPEFAEQTVVTPSEESKQDDVPFLEETLKGESPITEVKLEDLVTVAATASVAATVGAVVASKTGDVAGTKKSAVPATKKPAAKSSGTKLAPRTLLTQRTSDSAPPAKSPSNRSVAPKISSSTTKSPSTHLVNKTKPAAPPAPKPKSSPVPSSRLTEKKSVTNGDVPLSARSSLTTRKDVPAAKATSRPASSTARLSATKPAVPKSSPTPKPTSASAPRSVAAPKPPQPRTTVPPKRPTTLSSSRTVTSASATSTASKVTSKMSPSLSSVTNAAAPAKPRVPLSSTASKPRVPLTRSLNRAIPDATDKQSKDSANKLTASRSVTNKPSVTSSARTMTVRKLDSKTSATRMTVSKTSSTMMKSTTAKKPAEIVRTASKTKATKIEKPKQNGISTVVTEEITVTKTSNSIIENEPQLIKDISPTDNNKPLVESLFETSTAAD